MHSTRGGRGTTQTKTIFYAAQRVFMFYAQCLKQNSKSENLTCAPELCLFKSAKPIYTQNLEVDINIFNIILQMGALPIDYHLYLI